MSEGSPPEDRDRGGVHGAASRVVRNSSLRAAAELVGKFSTLALMVVLAREEGPTGLGIFVFALAWSELTAVPIEMGFDRHLMRLIARDRGQLASSFFNVLALKGARAVPVVAVSWLVAVLVYEGDTRAAIILLTLAFLLDTVRDSVVAVFTAHERADLVGLVLVAQRLLSGALGLAVLLLGYGVVGVAAVYVVASGAAVGVALALFARRIGMPRVALPRAPRRALQRHSLAFAGQEVLSAGMARLDVLLLSVFATQAVVGLYGGAYRLLEATLFISTALLGSFSPMFTYLDEHSEPTIHAAFSRAVKLSFCLLLPCGIALGTLPRPILELFYGPEFGDAAGALRVLAPTVVILGNVLLTGSLIASRLSPRLLLRSFIVAFTVNLVGNLVLIPLLGATGAALAMLLCEVVLGVILLRIVVRAVGRPAVAPTLGSAAVAGLAMAAVLLLLPGPVLAVLAAGSVVYGLVFVLVERRVAPEDLRFATAMVRGRLRGRRAAAIRDAV